jgi:hypothetical protein
MYAMISLRSPRAEVRRVRREAHALLAFAQQQIFTAGKVGSQYASQFLR